MTSAVTSEVKTSRLGSNRFGQPETTIDSHGTWRVARAQAEGLRARFEEADTENRAFASLDADGGERLRRELEALWSAHNRAGTDCTTVLVEYLEVIGVRA